MNLGQMLQKAWVILLPSQQFQVALTIAQDRVQMSARFKGKIQGPSENNEI
jgi:hypothetical protein